LQHIQTGTRFSARPPQPPRTRAPLLLLIVAGLSPLLLAACGGSKSSSPPTTLAGTTTTVNVPPYDPARNARHDVVAGACVDNGAKGWSLSGTVTNSSTTAHRYSIVVDFVTVPGDTVVDTKLASVTTVQPDATARWEVSGAAPGTKNLTCVIRQSLTT